MLHSAGLEPAQFPTRALSERLNHSAKSALLYQRQRRALKNISALSGNRTRDDSLEESHDTTSPSVLLPPLGGISTDGLRCKHRSPSVLGFPNLIAPERQEEEEPVRGSSSYNLLRGISLGHLTHRVSSDRTEEP
jgi:hypothetical protein